MDDAKLQTMERVLCGLERADDLPGSFAPAAWYDFLGARAHRLEDVFRHNEDDVLSLVVLTAHLGRTWDERRADGSDLSGDALARARGVVRTLDALRRRLEAAPWLERARARGSDADDAAFEKVAARVRRATRLQR